MNQYLLIIDNNTISRYEEHYFRKYPKRKKNPIENPTHPSINQWMIMKRQMMNDLKGKWKDFIVWFVEDQKMSNMKIEKCNMTFISYFRTKVMKDVDNTVPKFILDGFVEGGLIIDDNYLHLESITLKCGYSKENPRTEIYIYVEE